MNPFSSNNHQPNRLFSPALRGSLSSMSAFVKKLFSVPPLNSTGRIPLAGAGVGVVNVVVAAAGVKVPVATGVVKVGVVTVGVVNVGAVGVVKVGVVTVGVVKVGVAVGNVKVGAVGVNVGVVVGNRLGKVKPVP